MKRRHTLPLVHDHHSHATLYAAMDGIPDLGGLDAQAAETLLGSLPQDRLSLVKGWRSDRLKLTAALLGRLPPVLVVNSSLHGYALSPSALPFVAALWPEFAERAFDPAWGERALPDLFVFYGRIAGLSVDKLRRFMKGLEALGLASVEDMTVAGSEGLRAIDESGLSGAIRPWATPRVFEGLSQEERVKCAGIKLFLDGSLGARSAALDEPFLDGSRGLLLYTDEELLALLSFLAAYRTGLSVHAIGHRAIGQVIATLRRLRLNGLEFPTVRLEHVQFISEEQGRAARELGIALSMQPNFSADSVDYGDRLCSRHLGENNPFRMLIDRLGFHPGVDLLFGSDGMPHGCAEALRCALFPPFEGQRLSEEEYAAGSRDHASSAVNAPTAVAVVDYSSRRVAVEVR